MLLNEAVKHARKELKMSQKKLAELAGIQRRQLATLENGGNITLSTLRKVLIHLPNLETFALDAVTATVRRYVPPEETQQAVESAMNLLGTALKSLVTALSDGTVPDQNVYDSLKRGTTVLYEGLGLTAEDAERDRHRLALERATRDELSRQQTPEEIAAFIAEVKATVGEDEPEAPPAEDEDDEDGA